MAFFYKVFGWNVTSEIALNELWEAESFSKIDVAIRLGQVPKKLDGAVKNGVGYQVKQGHYLLTIRGVARYMVVKGAEVVIEIDPNAEIEDVKVFLYASVFGALSHLRNALPIHAGAIAHKDGVYLFAGKTGAGKSTTVAEMQRRGYDVLTDDLTPISFTKDFIPMTTYGIGRIKLWSDALEKLQISYKAEDRIRGELEKFNVFIHKKPESICFKVKKIFILEPYSGEELRFKTLFGKEALIQLIQQTFRYQLLEGFGLKENHFNNCSQLLRGIELILIKVPRAEYKLNELGDWIEKNIDR